jgi:hypothetical protein
MIEAEAEAEVVAIEVPAAPVAGEVECLGDRGDPLRLKPILGLGGGEPTNWHALDVSACGYDSATAEGLRRPEGIGQAANGDHSYDAGRKD